MTVKPGQKGTAGVEEVPDSGTEEGALLVRGMAVGICGTDREIAEGGYGTPPSGAERLIIGHESLGEVLEAPAGSGFSPGDLVVGIVLIGYTYFVSTVAVMLAIAVALIVALWLAVRMGY